MDLSGAVRWWDEWQLRVLVICSLLMQWMLFFSAASRKFHIPGWFRFFIWLSYLASDALTIYALATLFNRQKQPSLSTSSTASAHGGTGSRGLEVLWAPVLLIHLGGQDPITAYNIEDNELWTRHVVTVVSQVMVSVYVFCKSWSGEKRLLQSAILLFVAGFLKGSERPWALNRASIHSLVSSASDSRLVSFFLKDREEDFQRFIQTAERVARMFLERVVARMFQERVVARVFLETVVARMFGLVEATGSENTPQGAEALGPLGSRSDLHWRIQRPGPLGPPKNSKAVRSISVITEIVILRRIVET